MFTCGTALNVSVFRVRGTPCLCECKSKEEFKWKLWPSFSSNNRLTLFLGINRHSITNGIFSVLKKTHKNPKIPCETGKFQEVLSSLSSRGYRNKIEEEINIKMEPKPRNSINNTPQLLNFMNNKGAQGCAGACFATRIKSLIYSICLIPW